MHLMFGVHWHLLVTVHTVANQCYCVEQSRQEMDLMKILLHRQRTACGTLQCNLVRLLDACFVAACNWNFFSYRSNNLFYITGIFNIDVSHKS